MRSRVSRPSRFPTAIDAPDGVLPATRQLKSRRTNQYEFDNDPRYRDDHVTQNWRRTIALNEQRRHEQKALLDKQEKKKISRCFSSAPKRAVRWSSYTPDPGFG